MGNQGYERLLNNLKNVTSTYQSRNEKKKKTKKQAGSWLTWQEVWADELPEYGRGEEWWNRDAKAIF